MNSVKMFRDNEQGSVAKRAVTIIGNRPSPLKINRDSHPIHKHQPTRMAGEAHRQRQRQPIIIYTHSPKVIHTRPHDFMALVQKLTGISTRRSDQDQTLDVGQVIRACNDNETCSNVTDVINGGDQRNNVQGNNVEGDNISCDKGLPNYRFSGFSPMGQQNQHSYFLDVPMFTPTSIDHNNLMVSPSTLCGSISPSMFKFLEGLPEY